MPNHVTNRLTFLGEAGAVNNLLNAIAGPDFEDGSKMFIDFNKITPMPESLGIESGSLGENAQALLFGQGRSLFLGIEQLQGRFREMPEERQKESIDLALAYHKNTKEHGASTWYEWCPKHWGTKWNAYDQKCEAGVLFFDTAWSAPIDLIQKLSGMFPDVEIQHTYADEDSGSNTGRVIYKAGETTSCNQPESASKEGYEIYFELNPEDRANYVETETGFEYREEEAA